MAAFSAPFTPATDESGSDSNPDDGYEVQGDDGPVSLAYGSIHAEEEVGRLDAILITVLYACLLVFFSEEY